MDRGGMKTLIILLPFESAFRIRIISGGFGYLLLPPMLPHSCPPARVTKQSQGRGEIGQSPKMVKGEVYGVVARGFDRNEGRRKLPQDYSF